MKERVITCIIHTLAINKSVFVLDIGGAQKIILVSFVSKVLYVDDCVLVCI